MPAKPRQHSHHRRPRRNRRPLRRAAVRRLGRACTTAARRFPGFRRARRLPPAGRRGGADHQCARPNAPIREQVLQLGVSPDAFDAIVTSGDVTIALIAERIGAAVHHIGPSATSRLFEAARRSGQAPARLAGARRRGLCALHRPVRRRRRDARRLRSSAARHRRRATCRSSAPIPTSSCIAATSSSIAPARSPNATRSSAARRSIPASRMRRSIGAALTAAEARARPRRSTSRACSRSATACAPTSPAPSGRVSTRCSSPPASIGDVLTAGRRGGEALAGPVRARAVWPWPRSGRCSAVRHGRPKSDVPSPRRRAR